MGDDQRKPQDRLVVLIVALIILAALILAGLSENEGLVRCRERIGA